MIQGYWKSNGKIPTGKEDDRILLPAPPEAGDYVAVYKEGRFARIDVDDFSHQTGEIEEPIHGSPRSEAVLKYLNKHGYKYNAIRTEHGVHINTLFYIDYECNDYMEEWNFENWGIKYWAQTPEFIEYIKNI